MERKNCVEYPITNNFMFCKVMSKPAICTSFLEKLLDVKIDNIIVHEPEFAIDSSIDARSIRIDVFAETEGRVFDIEMQTANKSDEPLNLRTRYYQSSIDRSCLDKGHKYKELSESYIIFICTFDPFKLGLSKYTFCTTCIENKSLLLDDKAKKIFLYTNGDSGSLNTEIVDFLHYANGDIPLYDLAKNVHNEVCRINKNEAERGIIMTLQEEIDSMIENTTQKVTAEVTQKVTQEVSTQKAIAVAKSMLSSGMDIGNAVELLANSGFSPDDIAAALQAAGAPKEAVASALREAGKTS